MDTAHAHRALLAPGESRADAPRPSRMLDVLARLLAQADVKVNGDRPWDIRIHDARTASRVLALGSLGLGESYMDGWWDCEALDEFFCRILRARLDERFRRMWRYYLLACAGTFRARTTQLWQVVLSPGGVANGYSRTT